MPVAPITRYLAILAVVLFGLGASSSSEGDIDSILVRVATWNIETVGAPGSTEYEAALDVLNRIGADIVAINEVASSADAANLTSLAADAGYASVVVPSSNPFGADRNAILTDLPLLSAIINTSADLSGDPAANDISRLMVEVTVDMPGDAPDLTVVSSHWKSGTGNDDEFRRVVESRRMAQAVADLDPLFDAYILLGDINEEADNVPQTPNPMVSEPSGLPGSFKLGSDLEALLVSGGLVNDPFTNLSAAQVSTVPAVQLDGRDATRPASGRRLDYIFVSPVIAAGGVLAEVYDSSVEGLFGGLSKSGDVLPAGTSAAASDHLLVFADIELTPPCGNGRVDSAEQCDDGPDNGSSSSCCRADCTFKPDGAGSCDGNLCTRTDSCLSGVCSPGSCETGSACSICGGTCEDGTGLCECQY